MASMEGVFEATRATEPFTVTVPHLFFLEFEGTGKVEWQVLRADGEWQAMREFVEDFANRVNPPPVSLRYRLNCTERDADIHYFLAG